MSNLEALRAQAYERVAQALKLSEEEKAKYCWPTQARSSQRIPSGDWRIWLILAGRGFGKTRAGSETLRQWATEGIYKHIALIGATEDDVRQVMVEGPSGLLEVHPPEERPVYEPSLRRLTWPNGVIAKIYSAENYEHLRGPQFDAAWIDELAKFRHDKKTWDQLNFCLRLGPHPRVIVTTTPRPTRLLKSLLQQEGTGVVITRGSTFENQAHLSPSFLATMEEEFKNTRIGRQELFGELLEKEEAALWSPDVIERYRVESPPSLRRIVVAIDPAMTSTEKSDETGIIVAGLGQEGHAYVLEDLSGRLTPPQWVERAIAAYQRHQADRLVAEINQGGDLVEKMLRLQDARVSYKGIRATRGKILRAEPIAALYERGKVHHVKKGLEILEKQLLSYTAESSKSPDRLDALVWGLTELMLSEKPTQNSLWV